MTKNEYFIYKSDENIKINLAQDDIIRKKNIRREKGV